MKELDLGVKWFRTQFYPENKTCRAVRFEDGVLPRFREKQITLFTPWGPRYSYKDRGIEIHSNDSEVEALRLFAEMLKEFQTNMPGKKWKWIFLAADLYGIRINHLPEKEVYEYFNNLHRVLLECLPSATFRFWSEFDSQIEKYRKEISTNFGYYVHQKIFQRTVQAAEKLRRGGDARVYCIERVAEAMLIEAFFHPIKISAVRRDKDDGLDAELPRLYFLPDGLQAPWL